jgi:hypothetical protein
MASINLWLYNKECLKAQLWAISKAITSTLNPIILACVMNQFRHQCLLSNALTITITLTMNMEAKLL